MISVSFAPANSVHQTLQPMKLGAFSVSLAVKDIGASRAFYETLGFEIVGGNEEQNWLILRNQNHTIGLFQGMFDSNIMTFNPGWDDFNNAVDDFTDVREIQAGLKRAGVNLISEADESSNGPANIMLTDPDGNVILIDQHV